MLHTSGGYQLQWYRGSSELFRGCSGLGMNCSGSSRVRDGLPGEVGRLCFKVLLLPSMELIQRALLASCPDYHVYIVLPFKRLICAGRGGGWGVSAVRHKGLKVSWLLLAGI